MRILPALVVAGALALSPCVGFAQEDATGATLVSYRAQQMQRLAALGDRDSLIAAALVGLGEGKGEAPAAGHEEVLRRLYAEHGDDELALFAVALACQAAAGPCGADEAPAALLRIAPGNAVHWLMQPPGATVDAARLHSAAEAGIADSHHSQLLAIVRNALASQAAPTTPDLDALALDLRLRVQTSLPYPAYGAAMDTCNARAAAQAALAAAGGDGEALRQDCANLGTELFSDKNQQVVTRMYGGTLVRRFAPNSPMATEALAFRRQYLWLDQLRIEGGAGARDQLEDEAIVVGEWEALQKQAERSGSTRSPPDDWQPADPSALLLPEFR